MSNVSQTSRGASVFITGGRGFLGRHVCSLFESESVRILAPSRQELDLTHAADVRAYIRGPRPEELDTLIHNLPRKVSGLIICVQPPSYPPQLTPSPANSVVLAIERQACWAAAAVRNTKRGPWAVWV